MVAHSMKAGSGCSSIAVYIDSKGYASISIATDVHRCAAYIGKVGVSRFHNGVNDGRVRLDTRPARWSMRDVGSARLSAWRSRRASHEPRRQALVAELRRGKGIAVREALNRLVNDPRYQRLPDASQKTMFEPGDSSRSR
jgi:hypothetical protein